MREDNLLAVQPRAFVVTTDSAHDLEIFLNLACRIKVTGINQLWLADITYIRLQREFVYLPVMLAAFSRKVVGWALDRTPASRLVIAAPAQAIACREPPPGLVHHSDRGVRQLREAVAAAPHDSEHEPPGEPLRQRELRKILEDAQTRGDYANDYRTLEHLAAVALAPQRMIEASRGCERREA